MFNVKVSLVSAFPMHFKIPRSRRREGEGKKGGGEGSRDKGVVDDGRGMGEKAGVKGKGDGGEG